MRVTHRQQHLYRTIQSGGMPVFRGLPRQSMRGAGFLGKLKLRKVFNKVFTPKLKNKIKEVGKRTLKKIGPVLAKNVAQAMPHLLSGNYKAAAKNMMSNSKDIIKIGKSSLRDEIAKYHKGGNILSSVDTRRSKLMKRKRNNKNSF